MARVSGIGSSAGGHVVLLSSDVQGGTANGQPCYCSGQISHEASSSFSGFSFKRYMDDYMGAWQVYCKDDDDVPVHDDDDDDDDDDNDDDDDGCFQF